MRSARWVIERDLLSIDKDVLQLVEIYKVNEIKEIAKKEHKEWTHKISKILV